jgi:hypothetical protein
MVSKGSVYGHLDLCFWTWCEAEHHDVRSVRMRKPSTVLVDSKESRTVYIMAEKKQSAAGTGRARARR